MILTDYLPSQPSLQWEYALQCGVTNAVIRLPEDDAFDPCDPSHWATVCKRFRDRGIRPLVVEPMPNALHDHIKAGDSRRDECIEKAAKMLPIMAKEGVTTLCYNFMAHVGWTRTSSDLIERGGALVTGFDLNDYQPTEAAITERELWNNYTALMQALVPAAERSGVKLALHPDDPPLPKLGNVSRIMISLANIQRALEIGHSPNAGVTFCQATYAMMGEDLYQAIPALKERIFFVHFRNVTGDKTRFRETCHDNGELDMAALLRLYQKCGVDAPIRVDHVPTLAGERNDQPGYAALGRLFAIGYLKGLLDGTRPS